MIVPNITIPVGFSVFVLAAFIVVCFHFRRRTPFERPYSLVVRADENGGIEKAKMFALASHKRLCTLSRARFAEIRQKGSHYCFECGAAFNLKNVDSWPKGHDPVTHQSSVVGRIRKHQSVGGWLHYEAPRNFPYVVALTS